MSLSKTFFGATLLALLLFACSVDAHAWMSSPSPRGQYKTPKKYSHEEYAPTAGNNPNSQEFVCRNDPVMPKANWLPLTAGQSQSITLEFNAIHPGDCFVYLTYDGDKPTNEMKWFKIWQQHECYKRTSYTVDIPSYLPSGEHVIFRWEWYALHAYPTVEYYTQCVDATITGASSITGSSGSLPSPQVNIPGHLPILTGDILSNTNTYWWPYDQQAMFFTGPVLASLSGQPSTPAPTATPTKAPTVTPTATPTKTPTIKPTSTPTITPTIKPTSTPTITPTIKPTSTPTTTPTYKPTSPPTVTPTTRPTSPPVVPTVAPTTRPIDAPAQSVKLLVNPSSSVWWFALSITGHRASEVSKVEIKDSGSVSSFKTMFNEWDDVYTFNPNELALVLPLTVKASLASGSSVTFTVNTATGTTIDSGAVFP